MRLLPRPPETPPSLETWLGRDVPHEREMASELMEKMGREKSLEALLFLYDKEETKRENQRRALHKTHLALIIPACLSALYILTKPPAANKIYTIFLADTLVTTSGIIEITAAKLGYGQHHKASERQKNIVTALFNYDDSPFVADPLCRALSYYYAGQKSGPWLLYEHIKRVLPLLPDDKNTLTGNARRCLRNSLFPSGKASTKKSTQEQDADRTFHADFQIAVLRYFARTCDRDALPAIRKIAKAKTFSSDGERVQNAACVALLAFEKPTA